MSDANGGTILGELAAVGAAASWALGSLLFERVNRRGDVPAAGANLGKCAFGAVVLLGASVVTTGRVWPAGVSRGEVQALVASALVGLSLGDTAFFAALREIGASRAVLLLSTAPVFVVVAELLGSGRVPPWGDALGIALVLVGVGLVLWQPTGGAVRWRGVVWGLVAAVGQAGGSLLSRAATQGSVDALTAAWFRLLVGVAALALGGLVMRRLGEWLRPLGSREVAGRMAVAATVGTVLGLFLMQWGLAHSRSGGVASALLSLSPVFALPLAHGFGTERVTRRAVVGAVIAVGGVWVLLG